MYFAKSSIWILMLMLTMSVEAGVYKWVDENGKVHYGDKPISSTADEIKLKKNSKSGTHSEPANRKDLQQRFLRARKEDRAEKDKARKEAKRERAEKKIKCASAKKEYDKYRYAGSIYNKGKDGEREYMSVKERAAYERSLSDTVKRWCK